MICPQCGTRVHRSHSRNFAETAVKSVTPYKIYRCTDCGWRGMLSRDRKSTPIQWRVMLVWAAGLVTALLIGLYAAKVLAAE